MSDSPIARLTKGQTLYREKPRCRHDYNHEREIEAVTVATVGTKYFTIEQDRHNRYLRTTLRGEDGHPYEPLRRTAEEITDEWARHDLQRRLRWLFDHEHLPLDKLRQVEAIFPATQP